MLKTGSTFPTTYIHKMFYFNLSYTVFSLYTFSSRIRSYQLCQMLSVTQSYFLAPIFEVFLLSSCSQMFFSPQTFGQAGRKFFLLLSSTFFWWEKNQGIFMLKIKDQMLYLQRNIVDFYILERRKRGNSSHSWVEITNMTDCIFSL